MPRLSFTTVVEAPLTVAYDVAQTLGHPWPVPMEPVREQRPTGDAAVSGPWEGCRRLSHVRRFSATAAGTQVEDEVSWEPRGPLTRWRTRRRLRAAMAAHLAAYVELAVRRARDVVQVVGAAVVDGDRVLVAQRSGGPYDGLWEFPGGKVEPGESHLAALARECVEELGLEIEPGVFLGEVLLDGVVAGGAPGASTLRVWSARAVGSGPVAHEHAALRWVAADELDGLDWIAADRPLLPAVRRLLAGGAAAGTATDAAAR